jgi:methionyl-tRNA synthetase
MSEPKRHLVTCALPYANGPIHIGHLAGCLLPSDIYVRHLRSLGKEVMFISGTDEHGVPITLKARKEGSTSQEVVDRYYEVISKSLKNWGLEFDNFSRTTRPIHHETAKDFFKVLYDKGVFIEETTEQYFDQEANQFLADRYITGDCPNCGFDQAYGDQCEKCGRSLSPSELINPKSSLTGNVPILKATKNWYLPLDKIQKEFLDDYVEGHRDDWKAHVSGQCRSWLKEGLIPRAMTRDLDWGVDVPIPGAEGKVMYVWFDAPIGYISATKEVDGNWKKWWMDDACELTHFIGKDNIVFHCIIFPAMLHVHGDYILPTNIPANEFLNLEGKKISTSRNHAVWLHEYLQDFPNKNDELRYVLTSIMPETADADFSWLDFQARVNNELVAILGNWVNRVLVLCHKYYKGVIPEWQASSVIEELKAIESMKLKASDLTSKFKFREALGELMNIARLGNKFLQDQAPWHKIKETDGAQDVANCIGASVQFLWEFATAATAYLPETSDKIFKLLGSNEIPRVGQQLNEASLLFQKIEDEEIEKQKAKLAEQSPVKTLEVKSNPLKEEIQYEDFAKLDLRVGTIKEAVSVPKADRLLQLTVDMGFEVRTVVSGIAEHFKSEDIIGQQVVVVCNLAPRKLRGIMSQGMILMAENSDGKLEFVSASTIVDNGSGVS